MEQDEQAVALYDFLYRDVSRIASYYAQIFSGRLTQLEETNSERDTKDQGAKLSVHVVSGDVKASSEIQSSTKRIIDPHDLITTDVLSYLISKGRIASNVATAPHGALVLANGTLLFIDKYMLEMATVALDIAAKSRPKPKTQQERNEARGTEILKSFLSRVSFPSAFLLRAKEGFQVAGTIKDEGMEEPISSYYFKHGTSGLLDVYIIGIKEVSSVSFTLPDSQLLGAGQQAAQALTDLMFPDDAIMVTPIAFFRKL